MEELKRYLADGPTEQEVADAKNAWLEQQKVSRSNDGSVAGQMASNLNLDRTFAFIGQRENRVSRIDRGRYTRGVQEARQPCKTCNCPRWRFQGVISTPQNPRAKSRLSVLLAMWLDEFHSNTTGLQTLELSQTPT